MPGVLEWQHEVTVSGTKCHGRPGHDRMLDKHAQRVAGCHAGLLLRAEFECFPQPPSAGGQVFIHHIRIGKYRACPRLADEAFFDPGYFFRVPHIILIA